jgi:HAD superfamily phosphatase (TIGR01668 family)
MEEIQMILYPKAHFKSVKEITIQFLQKNKIKALILDVDNTLIDYNKKLEKDIVNWANNLKMQGTKLYILSNSNNKEKIEKVANILEIEYENFAKKPSKQGFLKIEKKINEKSEHIGVVGDQIFTDIIGGNRANMFTILVDPIDKKDYFYTAWKRPLENMIKNRYKKQTIKEKK